MTDLLVEILDQNWVRKSITGDIMSCSITEELGQVGGAEVEIPVNNPIIDDLPDPDALNPYEGRFRIYEDGVLKFSGVIDATTRSINETGDGVKFGGKQRGILLGYYNTGRRDFLGWQLPELYRELLRDNIGKMAALVATSSEEGPYLSVSMVGGDPHKANYWKSLTATPPHTTVFDLGKIENIDAIRVMPQWWKDPDTLAFHYHNFTIETSNSPAGGSFTLRATKNDSFPSSAQGHLYEFVGLQARYIRFTVTGSSDGYARIAQVLVLQNIAAIGPETTYTTPFIENDDSGNITITGTYTRPITPGAFQGDQVITYSAVTKLEPGAIAQQVFLGTSTAVFFTTHTDGGGVANIYFDGVFQEQITIPDGKYWFKGWDSYEKLGLLPDDGHILEVEAVSGNVPIDYFNGNYRYSWRPIEDDDPSLAYLGTWSQIEGPGFHNFFSSVSNVAGNELHYRFTGDRIRIIGSKGPGFGSMTAYVDGNPTVINLSNATQIDKQVLLDYDILTFAEHNLRIVTGAGAVYIDRLEGNMAHTMYIRARYEPNIKVLTRMSEILDSYLRFNDDGSVDLLGSLGGYGGTIVREGENEGGSIITASVENNYTETGSVCIALVNVNGEAPIKAMVVDREALAEIGYKVIKLENSDAADEFLLNRQAIQYLRDHRKPNRAYDIQFDADEVGLVAVGETTKLYSPTAGLDGEQYRVGKITTEYR